MSLKTIFFRRSNKPENENEQAKKRRQRRFFVHPLFFLVGVWFCLIGKLPLFLMSTLVALQHECAHAFAAARLGMQLNKIVLMPYGAVVDGDVKGLSFKDAAFVALAGPLANLLTAGAFVALWWLYPTTYAFTDTACYASLSVALVNLLPAYPLDGGRILKSGLLVLFSEKADRAAAQKKADKICKGVTLAFALAFLLLFIAFAFTRRFHATLLMFALFLLFGARSKNGGDYEPIDLSYKNAFDRGVEIRRVAVLESFPLKKVLSFISKESYLVIEVYDENENFLGELPQNAIAELLVTANPYAPVGQAFSLFTKNTSKKVKNGVFKGFL